MSPRPWPALLAETHAHPGDVAPPWSEHVQGIAHGSGYWFVTQADQVWRIPMTRELGAVGEHDRDVVRAGIPEPGVDHLGDCDVDGGVLYVAMEGTDPARIGAFDLDLRFRGSAPVAPQGTKCSWCAVNPVDGLLYSSDFHADRLHTYRPSRSGGAVGLEHTGEVRLRSDDGSPLRLRRMQGGAFSPHGHLYLTSDIRGGGLYGVEVRAGRCRMHVTIRHEPDWPEKDVIEGMTVVDLSDGVAPHMSGVVHVLVFDGHGPRPDYVWLRHFDVADESDRACFDRSGLNPSELLDAAGPAASG